MWLAFTLMSDMRDLRERAVPFHHLRIHRRCPPRCTTWIWHRIAVVVAVVTLGDFFPERNHRRSASRVNLITARMMRQQR